MFDQESIAEYFNGEEVLVEVEVERKDLTGKRFSVSIATSGGILQANAEVTKWRDQSLMMMKPMLLKMMA